MNEREGETSQDVGVRWLPENGVFYSLCKCLLSTYYVPGAGVCINQMSMQINV